MLQVLNTVQNQARRVGKLIALVELCQVDDRTGL
jgi:hypothetical protein